MKNRTLTRRSSIPQILYQIRENIHFLHIPKTNRANKKGLMLRRQWMSAYPWIHDILSCFLYFKLLVLKQNIYFNNTPKTIKLVYVASPQSTQYYGERAGNQNNVSEWSDMSTRRLLFQWTGTIKITLNVLV